MVAIVFAGCVNLQRPDAIWEAPGPIRVRIVLKYSLGHDYYFFEARSVDTGGWKRVMSVWRDATGIMPQENVRSLNSEIAYLFLEDQVATTTDSGSTWSVFNTSKYFECGFDGCAPIKDCVFSSSGAGTLNGSKRIGTDWVEFKLETGDFGKTWHGH